MQQIFHRLNLDYISQKCPISFSIGQIDSMNEKFMLLMIHASKSNLISSTAAAAAQPHSTAAGDFSYSHKLLHSCMLSCSPHVMLLLFKFKWLRRERRWEWKKEKNSILQTICVQENKRGLNFSLTHCAFSRKAVKCAYACSQNACEYFETTAVEFFHI